MNPIRTAMVGVLALALCDGAEVPGWLAPPAGVNVKESQSKDGALEMSFTASGTLEDAVQHFKKQMSAAGVAFNGGHDGIGISLRANHKERSALLRFREADDGIAVRIQIAADGPAPEQVASATASAPAPAIRAQGVWPAWFSAPPGVRLSGKPKFQRRESGYGLEYELPADGDITRIVLFYQDLFRQHGYTTDKDYTWGRTAFGRQGLSRGVITGRLDKGAPDFVSVELYRGAIGDPISATLRAFFRD